MGSDMDRQREGGGRDDDPLNEAGCWVENSEAKKVFLFSSVKTCLSQIPFLPDPLCLNRRPPMNLLSNVSNVKKLSHDWFKFIW